MQNNYYNENMSPFKSDNNNVASTYKTKTDYGPNPFVTDINKATIANNNYRIALWTGTHLQTTLMSIPAGGEIGLEVHPDTDQFLRLEEGNGITVMGNEKNNLTFQAPVYNDSAIFIPAGTWHNIINTGANDLKLYSIYAPPHHPHGTVEKTKAIADANEKKSSK